MFMFYPNISRLGYKSKEFNDTHFNDFINYVFTNMYYQDSKVKLFADKNEFYNNEEIEIKLLNNSSIDFEKSYILISNDLNNITILIY